MTGSPPHLSFGHGPHFCDGATSPLVYGKIGPRLDDWAVIEPDGSSFDAIRVPRPDHVDLLHLDWTLGFAEFVEVARK